MEPSLQRKSSDASVLNLSDSAVHAKLRPLVITVAFLLFFVSVAGVFLMLPLGKSGRVDFRHLYTAGYGTGGHAADVSITRCAKNSDRTWRATEGALPFNILRMKPFFAPFRFKLPDAYAFRHNQLSLSLRSGAQRTVFG
jgi:hypothetical protein